MDINIEKMKQAIILLSLFFIPFLISAQTLSVDTYCLIIGTKVPLKKKVIVQVDFGQGIKFWKPQQSVLKDANGKTIKFESMIDALNHLASQGWSFVDAYAVSNGNSHVYNWIMKKEVPASEVE